MEEILIPIGVCVVLPVMIVWLVNRTRQNDTNRKTEIILKAIEAGAPIDANFFKAQNDTKTVKERLLKHLSGGCTFALIGIACEIIGIINMIKWDGATSNDSSVVPMVIGGICLAIGISLLIVFFVGRKMLAKEIEAEEKALENK